MRNLKLIDLKNNNGLKINAFCTNLFSINKISQINEFPEIVNTNPRLVIGSGSNIFFLAPDNQPLTSTILLNKIKGKEIIKEKNNKTFVRCLAGENWNDFVIWTLSKNLGGLENLVLIPGTVGAAPIQNIGAYGLEIKDRIDSILAWDFEQKKLVNFKPHECEFRYRNSLFKNQMIHDGWKKTRYFIISIDFVLWSEKESPLITSYDEVRKEIIGKVSPKKIAESIIKIRNRKLPDSNLLPNLGSFFQNPIVKIYQAKDLRKNFPKMPNFKVIENEAKISAAWLIDECKLKGYKVNDAGIYKKHSLIIVNYGDASYKDIMNLAIKIQEKVIEKFGICLTLEPNVISSSEKKAFRLSKFYYETYNHDY